MTPTPTVPTFELAPGVSVPRLINGCWQLAADHRAAPRQDDETLATLEGLAHLGLTTFDGADIYTGVETTLGRLRQRWAQAGHDPAALRVHTKFVPDRDALPTLDLGYVERIQRRSRQRLGVEALDLVQFHWWDFDIGGWLRTAQWLDALRNRGVIRHLGVTNFDAGRLGELLEAGVELVSNQVQVSLLDRRTEGALASLCQERGIALLAYGALAGGFLTNRWLGAADPGTEVANRSLTKYRLIIDEFGGWQLFQELLEVLDGIARRHSPEEGPTTSIAQVAVRWVLDRPAVGAVILGTSSVERGQSALDACALQLDAEDHARIEAVLARSAGPSGAVYALEREPGGRHAAIMKTHLNRD